MINAIYLLLVTIGTWLLKNVGPQILLALGVGFVSYTGFSAHDRTSTVRAMVTRKENVLFWI